MTVDAANINKLKIRAKESFDLAVSYGANRQEGIAILMKSGLILTGYSQVSPDLNAAKDALRGPLNDTTGHLSRQKIRGEFEIVAIIIVTKNEKSNPHKSTLKIINDFVGTSNSQIIKIMAADTEAMRDITQSP